MYFLWFDIDANVDKSLNIDHGVSLKHINMGGLKKRKNLVGIWVF